MRAFIIGLILFLSGCVGLEKQTDKPGFYWPDYKNYQTPSGWIVEVPAPLWSYPDLVDQALSEVDISFNPYRDQLLGWTVIIREPIYFMYGDNSYYDDSWVRGSTNFARKEISVGWRVRGLDRTLVLPALDHERDHALHPEDPLYGHK